MNDLAATREEIEARIKRTLHALRIEQEIYLRIFASRISVPNPLPGNTVIDACQEHLREAEYKHQEAIRYEDITHCVRCSEQGIGEDDEYPDDDRTFEIFTRQTDSDSLYYHEYLCIKCMADDDRLMARIRGE